VAIGGGTSNAGALADITQATAGAVTFPTWTTTHNVTGNNGTVWLGISVALAP